MELKVDNEAFEFYNTNYSPMFLYMQKIKAGGFEVVDVNTGNVIGNPTFIVKDPQCRCRYCGKSTPDVKFGKKEHVFPESIGNKLFISRGCECDTCNEYFGTHLEADLNTFLFPYLVMNNIYGKNGQKQYKSFDHTSRVKRTEDGLTISETIGSPKFQVDETKNEIIYEFDVGKHTLANVYKSLLKMALAILPFDEFQKYRIANNSLTNNCLIGNECFFLNFYPGFDRFDFTVIGFKRKIEDATMPSYQFAIMNGNFFLQIPIFNDDDIRKNSNRKINISAFTIPTPFDCSEIGNVQHQIFQIRDVEVTPAGKMNIVMKYDDKKQEGE